MNAKQLSEFTSEFRGKQINIQEIRKKLYK